MRSIISSLFAVAFVFSASPSLAWCMTNQCKTNVAKLERTKACPRCDLQGANLSGGDRRGANFSGADLRGAIIQGADLRGANFSGADLRGTNLQWTNLEGANLRGARLGGTYLVGAKFCRTTMPDGTVNNHNC